MTASDKGWPVKLKDGRTVYVDSPDYNGDPGADTERRKRKRKRRPKRQT